MRIKPIIICIQCGKEGKRAPRGLCTKCYNAEMRIRMIGVCIRCGQTKSIHARGVCETCFSNARYHQNKERYAQLGKESRARRADKIKAFEKERYQRRKASGYEKENTRRYYLRHPDKVAERRRSFHKKHPERASHYSQSYYAKKKGLLCDLTEEQWQQILAAHNHSCAYCGRTDVKLQREHKIPVSRGGGYTADNIVPACKRCNNRKCAMTDIEFREKLKREGI